MIAVALAFIGAASAVAGAQSLLAARRPRQGSDFGRRLAAAVPARLKPPLDTVARLEAAGSDLAPAEFMAIKTLAALATAPLAAVAATAAPGRLGPLVAAAIPAAAFFTPDHRLRNKTKIRIREARRDLPGLIDLLRVAIEAGMAPPQALAAVAERSSGALPAQFARAANEVGLGVPLSVALGRMTRRIPAPELEALTAAIQRASLHGAPLSDTLAAQARDARLARRRRIEEEAAKAAPKIQLVVALLLVPSVLLLVAASMLAAVLAH